MSDEEMFSTGQHQRVVMYGNFPVCDTCINVLGFNIRWDQSHPECGYDVGDPPGSCRCVLDRGHQGLHKCEHLADRSGADL